MDKGSSSSSSSATGAGGADSFSGLKFGKKIYFESVGSGFHQKTGGCPSPSAAQPHSPAKRGRTGVAQGAQTPRCQVEGCDVDLSGVKAYYSRHKVCGMHSKSAKVIVAGMEQRFCQQCSRFHQLPEFDQGKRSCRRRLAGHNERRRKPPSGSSYSSRYGNLCPSMFDHHSKAGGYSMDFGAYPSPTARDSWPNATTGRGLGSHTAISGKYQLPWQNNPQNPLSELLLGTMTRPDPSISVTTEECLSGVSDSTGALSLLSNEPWGSRIGSSSLGVNNFLGSTVTTMVQPSVEPDAQVIGQLGCRSWSLKGNHGMNHSHDMPPDLGLGQTSHTGNSHYTGELGLAQPNDGQYPELDHSRGYASSVQHMHWSL